MTTVRHVECIADKLLMAFGDKNPITPCLNSFVATISDRVRMNRVGPGKRDQPCVPCESSGELGPVQIVLFFFVTQP
jgi:hypothetical protein